MSQVALPGPPPLRAGTSALGGEADQGCSNRDSLFMTRPGHQQPIFAVTHNTQLALWRCVGCGPRLRGAAHETAARLLKVVPISAPVHGDVEIETAINALGREPGGGLVVMPDVFTTLHRAPIISVAARNNVPALYALSDAV